VAKRLSLILVADAGNFGGLIVGSDGRVPVSLVKSFAVGNGDMFYINHNSDNFTMIDCCLNEDNSHSILAEVKALRRKKTIARFISTHPDDDHFRGLELLEASIGIENFYCVKNAATKEDETDSFNKYCELRDDPAKAFYIYKGCKRRWMNESDEERAMAGIHILWPDLRNTDFKAALAAAGEGSSPNNISAIVKYSIENGVTVLWMGDLETEFMEAIEDQVTVP